MHFSFAHGFDIPLDALELAVLSPELATLVAANVGNVESIELVKHAVQDGTLERVLRYQANVTVPPFAKNYVTRDMLAWTEDSRYDMKTRTATWKVTPKIKPEWQKYFKASGSYALRADGESRTTRVIEGDIDLLIPVVGVVAEKLILGEVKKIYDAEAAAMKSLATLV
ncbi:MAG: DUF2505 family protein [Polyangiaceae bacterium]